MNLIVILIMHVFRSKIVSLNYEVLVTPQDKLLSNLKILMKGGIIRERI